MSRLLLGARRGAAEATAPQAGFSVY